MPAILFGSISTVADTSELQRDAFNKAFEAHDLSWRWSRGDYLAMVEKSGGRQRIAGYAASLGQSVDVEAIHRTKNEIFQESLATSEISPRAGVVETIQGARDRGMKVAFVTTTSASNIAALLKALEPTIRHDDFDAIVSASDVEAPKPDKAAYSLVLESLNESPGDCIAIEDNLGGVEAAEAAGVRCVAFPNENTAGHDFDAHRRVDRLSLDQLQQFLTAE
jgi:HAD superfamily hydrolase (TIGR01509 family)